MGHLKSAFLIVVGCTSISSRHQKFHYWSQDFGKLKIADKEAESLNFDKKIISTHSYKLYLFMRKSFLFGGGGGGGVGPKVEAQAVIKVNQGGGRVTLQPGLPSSTCILSHLHVRQDSHPEWELKGLPLLYGVRNHRKQLK